MGEKFAANPVTGTGSLSVPLPLSPGRGGFTPALSLNYDSGTGNGPFGFGWGIGLPSITRKTDKGLPRYWDSEESDVFVLSGAEDLVAVIQNGQPKIQKRTLEEQDFTVYFYRPRIEGLFARIERWVNSDGDSYWRSISKDNLTTYYGKTPESRIANPDNPLQVFSWLICESHDDKGNISQYQYIAEDSGKIDLSQINERNRTVLSRSSQRYLKRVNYGNTVSKLLPSYPVDNKWLFELVLNFCKSQ
jgi:hypothetical protein